MNNLGLLYNKEYFKGLSFDKNGEISFSASDVMAKVQSFRLQNEDLPFLGGHSFELKTVYPGLLHGVGYNHEIGGEEDEFKIGFYFDYTTGLPVINGSAVKGMLRAGCSSRKGYITDILTKRLKVELPDGFSEQEFIETVFVGKDKSIYKRDIFFEAVPIKSKKTLFGSDYTTPHNNDPLKNPIPVQFLRVQPEVTYKFQFDLKDSNGLSADDKMKLFKEIILDLGLGAKTNVGYGQFEE